MPRYEVGDAVTLSTKVTVGGSPVDATVVLQLTDPDGAVTTPAVLHVGAAGSGQYTSTFVLSKRGEWRYRWDVSGAATAVDSGSIFARDVATMLCDVVDVELALRVAEGTFTGADRTAVEAAIRGVSARVIGATGQKILRRQHTVTFHAAGTDDLSLPQRPLVSIDAVTLDGVVLTDLDYTAGGSSLFRAGWRIWGHPFQWSEIVVTYTAGYPYPPDDLADLVAQRVAGRIDTPRGVRQYSIGSFSATISSEEMEGTGWSPAEEEILRRYRHPAGRGLYRIGRP